MTVFKLSNDQSRSWRKANRGDIWVGVPLIVRIDGVVRNVIPTRLYRVDLPSDAGNRWLVTLKLNDGSRLTGVKIDSIEVSE